MKKKFLLDTNILMRSPNAIYVFDDNDVLICSTTLEELDNLKTKPGEVGYNAREAIRVLNALVEGKKDLSEGIQLPGSGMLRIVSDCTPDMLDKEEIALPSEWSYNKADNRIIDTAIKNEAILVTADISMLLKAQALGVKTESFRNEQVSEASLGYTSRREVYANEDIINILYQDGAIDKEDLIDSENLKLEVNEFLTIIDIANEHHTALAYYDGRCIILLKHDKTKPYGIIPRNSGQRFALEALLAPSEDVPLVILKGAAGTAKTFLSLACGLEAVSRRKEYKKLLILRPNIKFDDDIGYLKGDEMDKILPLIRPCLDNLEALVSNKADDAEKTNAKVKELFDKGIVSAEALAYLRGRSISNTYILIDEAQNTTPHQMLGIITRAGVGSKIVIVGDPDQIDNPKVDKKNNGLVYAAEKMQGNPLCMQLNFEDEECVRSPLALSASKLLTKKN